MKKLLRYSTETYWDAANNYYIIPCTMKSLLPPISFWFLGQGTGSESYQIVSVPPEDYFFTLDAGLNECTLMFRQSDAAYETEWKMGSPFI